MATSSAFNVQSLTSNPRPVLVTNRTVAMTNSLLASTILQCMSRTQHRTCAGGASNLRLVFQNFDNNNNTPQDGIANSNPLTVTASIEYGGNFYQARFNGSTSVVIAAGGFVVSDPIGVQIPGNTQFYVRNYAVMAAGPNTPSIPTNLQTVGSNGEGQILTASGGTDLTMSGTVTPASANTYAPVAIMGDAGDRNLRSIVMCMDSIAEGFGDLGSTEARGWIARAFSGIAGYHNMGVKGGTLSGWNTINPYCRYPMLSYMRPTHAFAGGPGNDMFSSGVLYTVAQQSLLTMWTGLKSMGIQPWTWTVGPHTNSTDNFATTANQTIDGGSYPGGNAAYLTARNAINAWIKTMPAPLAGYVDICPAIENDPVNGDGLWKANGTANYYTADGGHPTTAADLLIAALVPVASFNTFV